MVKKLFILMVCLGCFGSLYPIVSYRLFKGPEGRRLLVLGGHHSWDHTSHAKIVTDEFGMVKFSHPLSLVMELNEGKGVVAVPQTTAQIFSFAQSFPNKISLKRINPRETYSDAMTIFEERLYSYVDSMPPTPNLVGSMYPCTEADMQAIEKVRASARGQDSVIFPREWNLTVGGYLKYLKSCLEKLEKCKNRQPEEIARVYEKLILIPYRKTLKEICPEFDQFNLSMPLDGAFGNLFQQKCNTPAELSTFYENYNERYIGTIDALFFDGMLFDYLISQQTDTLCCVAVGDLHARGLKRLFEAVPGWSLLKDKSIYERISALLATVSYTKVPEFLNGLRDTVREYIRPLVLKCAVCSKTANLKKCGRCQSVRYCGIDCQKKAWQDHKAVCCPVEVEVKIPS